jgi:hypothetical protein
MTDDKADYHIRGACVHGGKIDRDKLTWLRDLLDDSVTLPQAHAAIQRRHFEGRAAASTVDAVVYELRTHGLAQLGKPNCQRRLGDLSPEQLREVIARLIRLRPRYPKIDDALLLQLEERLP